MHKKKVTYGTELKASGDGRTFTGQASMFGRVI